MNAGDGKGWLHLIWLGAVIAAVPLGIHLYYRLPADADAIAAAIFREGRFQRSTESEIIDAIERYGDLNGLSAERQSSFLHAATASGRDRVFDWLLFKRANPNPAGQNPLLTAIEHDNEPWARKLLHNGARWDAKISGGQTVLEASTQRRPDLVNRLWVSRPVTLPATKD